MNMSEQYCAATYHGTGDVLAGPYLIGEWTYDLYEAAKNVEIYKIAKPAWNGWNTRVEVITLSEYRGKSVMGEQSIKDQVLKLVLEDPTLMTAIKTTMIDGGTFEEAMCVAVTMLHDKCKKLEEHMNSMIATMGISPNIK